MVQYTCTSKKAAHLWCHAWPPSRRQPPWLCQLAGGRILGERRRSRRRRPPPPHRTLTWQRRLTCRAWSQRPASGRSWRHQSSRAASSCGPHPSWRCAFPAPGCWSARTATPSKSIRVKNQKIEINIQQAQGPQIVERKTAKRTATCENDRITGVTLSLDGAEPVPPAS